MTKPNDQRHLMRRCLLVRWWHWYGIYRRFFGPVIAARKAYRIARTG